MKAEDLKAVLADHAKWLANPSQGRRAAPYDHGRSLHDENFVYRVGEIVSVPDANLDPREVCTAGIHFFLTREEAEAYEG